MLDPANIASRLTGPQQRRLIALANAGKSLPWNRTDEALKALRLVQRYTGISDDTYAEINGQGLAVVRVLVESRANPASS